MLDADTTARLNKVVDTLAMQAMERPAGERHAFIEHEAAALKQDATRAYAGDATMIANSARFFDKVAESAKALVDMMEQSGGQTSNA